MPRPQQDPKLAHAYVRSLQQAVKAEDLMVVAQERFEIRSKILGYEISIQSAALIVSGSFVSAILSNINVFATIIQRRSHAYLRGFDVELAAVAEEPDVSEPEQIMDS